MIRKCVFAWIVLGSLSGGSSAAAPASAKEAQVPVSLKKVEEDQEPLFIKSNTLTLESRERVFTYRGNVEATKGDMKITSEVMRGNYDEENRIKTITAEGNVAITRGEDLKATSNRAVYTVATATIVLTEGPEVINNGNALTADKVTLFLNEDRSEAEGEVRVKVIKQGEEGGKGVLGGFSSKSASGDKKTAAPAPPAGTEQK
jgi:lipopolysaccharide transport protein LptA